jgi:putative transposase
LAGSTCCTNKTYRRSATFWEGRHKTSLIDAENRLLVRYRYIEMNPVAAGTIDAPEQHRWFSYDWRGWGRPNPLISDH